MLLHVLVAAPHRTAQHSTAQHTPQHRAERCPCRHHCPSVMLLCCCWRHACRIQVRTAHMPTVQLLMLSTCTVQLQRLLLSANPDPTLHLAAVSSKHPVDLCSCSCPCIDDVPDGTFARLTMISISNSMLQPRSGLGSAGRPIAIMQLHDLRLLMLR